MSALQPISGPKQLVVSIDTEEEGLWGGSYLATGNTTANLQGLERFQVLCERLGVLPTYLIDAPVLSDSQGIKHLRRWQEARLCEVGSHCHPWCNPPLKSMAPTPQETFLCNLPVEEQYHKLAWLTQRIADATGRAPTSYRAGRYGFDTSTAAILRDLDYRVDSSVVPLHEYRRQGGPDFRMSRREPHRLIVDEQGGELLEIPVTSGFTRSGYERRRRIWMNCRSKPWSRLRSAGVVDRLSIARRVKFSPEGTRLSDLRRLVDACVQDGLETLVLMLHSSSLAAGFSPYAESSDMLGRFYDRFTKIIQYAISEHSFTPATLTGAADSLLTRP